jgi:dihydrofolate reductase
MIIMIAAASKNDALGKNNDLLWHLPDDFKRFKQLTTGHYIIMGRKTFESFPKLLPNRTHVVITRQKKYAPDGCIVVDSLEKALQVVPEFEDVYVIGGGEIYQQALAVSDKIELTRVHAEFDADTFFPKLNPEHWKIVHEEFHPADERHVYSFTFQTFQKR